MKYLVSIMMIGLGLPLFAQATSCPPKEEEGFHLFCNGFNACFDLPGDLYYDEEGRKITVTKIKGDYFCKYHSEKSVIGNWGDNLDKSICIFYEPLNGCPKGEEFLVESLKISREKSDFLVAAGEGWKPEIDIPFQGEDSIVGVKQEPVAYINRVYKFATMIIGIMAALMFIIGGFQYITSAGNNAIAGEAKKTMFAALAGMAIVFGAYLLLRIINKELVDLENPKTTEVEMIKILKG